MSFSPAETAACCRLIEMALVEDLGTSPWWQWRDPTTALCHPPGYVTGGGVFLVRKAGTIAGIHAAELVFGAIDPQVEFEAVAKDGQAVSPGDVIARVKRSMQAILCGERIALNFLQHLSGIATLTSRYVRAVAGLPTKILDTRKTIPGWRLLAKYAVRQGGGHNHRTGLYDGILIKDNHLAWALPRFGNNITKLLQWVRPESGVAADLNMTRLPRDLVIEIEVDTLDQLDAALAGKPDIILLDNMTLDQMREAVRRRDQTARDILLEASGGVTLDTVRAIAETGVDRISVGALTHSAPALDIALEYAP